MPQRIRTLPLFQIIGGVLLSLPAWLYAAVQVGGDADFVFSSIGWSDWRADLLAIATEPPAWALSLLILAGVTFFAIGERRTARERFSVWNAQNSGAVARSTTEVDSLVSQFTNLKQKLSPVIQQVALTERRYALLKAIEFIDGIFQERPAAIPHPGYMPPTLGSKRMRQIEGVQKLIGLTPSQLSELLQPIHAVIMSDPQYVAFVGDDPQFFGSIELKRDFIIHREKLRRLRSYAEEELQLIPRRNT